MLDWLKRKPTPVPNEQPVESEHHQHSPEERLERLLDRLGTDGRTAKEHSAEVLELIERLSKSDSKPAGEAAEEAVDPVSSLPATDGDTAGPPGEEVLDLTDALPGIEGETASPPGDEVPEPIEPLPSVESQSASEPAEEVTEPTDPPPSAQSATASVPAADEISPVPAADEISPPPRTDERTAIERAAAALNEISTRPRTETKAVIEPTAVIEPMVETLDEAKSTPPSDRRTTGQTTGGSREMRVIAVCSQKGGAGKTTITAHLAVQAGLMGLGPVVLIDTDPQGSLGEWWRARNEETPALAHVKLEDLAANLAELRSYGTAIAIIDTPPALTGSIEQVIAVADLLLIPARPSPHDLRAVGATVEMARRAGKPFLFVVNGAAPRASITAQAVAALSEHGRVVPVIMYQRTDYAASMIDGRTVMETAASGRSAQEIGDLWQYVYEQIGMRVAA